MRKWAIGGGIVLLAAFLRLYKIGIIPHGYNWDEVSILYNSWGIALWHRDEWANLMPLAFRSFGDYKAPLIFYLLAIPFKVFDINFPLIRIYSALSGIVTVIATMGIAKILFKNDHKIAYLSGLLVGLSAWGINFSRVGFEANIGLGLTTIGLLTFLWALEKYPKMLSLSALFFSASLYAYHSTKIFLPILLVVLLCLYWGELLKIKKQMVVAGMLGFLCSLPLMYVTFFGNGFERGMTMIFFDDNHDIQPVGQILTEFIVNIKNQFSLTFLIGGKDAVGMRHLTPGFGILYPIQLPFLIAGLYFAIQYKQKSLTLLLCWILAGLMPAILSHQTPHAVRSLLSFPAIEMLVAVGWVQVSRAIQGKKHSMNIAFMCLSSLMLLVSFGGYIREYYDSYAKKSARDFQYGYFEALKIASELGRTREKIIVTDYYGQPYIYVLLQNRIKPEEFLAGALANYEFHSFTWPYYKPNSVIVGTPQEIPPNDPAVQATVKIPGTDEIVFVIATTPK